MRPHLITIAALACLAACSHNNTPEENPPEPSAELCGAIKTQRSCYDAGCAFFTNAASLTPDGQGACTRGPSFGVCLHAPDPDGPERLTSYTRTTSEGVQTVQLGQDVTIDGWSRCAPDGLASDCGC